MSPGRIAAAVAGIAGLDAVQAVREWPVPVVAALVRAFAGRLPRAA